MAEHQVLFCPFCRESFEARTSCPEHELILVTFDKLGPDPELDADDDDPELVAVPGITDPTPRPPVALDDRSVSLLEPRYGRAAVALGALLNLITLGCQLVEVRGFPTATVAQVALRIPTLWAIPLVSFTLLFVLLRRRSPRQLRGLRVLVPLLALVSPANLLWTFAMLDGFDKNVTAQFGSAFYVSSAASLLLLIAGSRLGMPLKPRA